jgi:hypothetical protein
VLLLALLLPLPARADPPGPDAAGVSAPAALLDRVAVRWYAPETGGPQKPQFIFARELAFEARLESLADPDPEPGPYHDRHVRAALDRHIAETLLAALPILPEADAKTLAAAIAVARSVLEQRVHGRAKLLEAAKAEAMDADEIERILERQAKAGIYLDRMVAPMLRPSEIELRDLLRTGSTPFKDMPYDQVQSALERWYVGQRLAKATDAYYQNARARVVMHVSRR